MKLVYTLLLFNIVISYSIQPCLFINTNLDTNWFIWSVQLRQYEGLIAQEN
jgi:hypothetical protein